MCRKAATQSLGLLLPVLVSLAVATFLAQAHGAEAKELTLWDAASKTLDLISKHHGWKLGEAAVTQVDVEESRVGRGVSYDISVGIEDREIEFTLATEVTALEPPQALPPSAVEGGGEAGAGLARLDLRPIPDFELAGPLELRVRDGDSLRIKAPHDVDAGRVRKVLISEGVVATIRGASQVALARPLRLPLPLPGRRRDEPLAAAILALTRHVQASNEASLGSLCLEVVSPQEIFTRPKGGERGVPVGRVKVRRLAAGVVELGLASSRPNANTKVGVNSAAVRALLISQQAWPLIGLNGSDPRLKGFEEALYTILGPTAFKQGSFQLLKARALPMSIWSIQFELALPEARGGKSEGGKSDEESPALMDEDGAKERRVQRWEATLKVTGNQVVPLNARPVSHGILPMVTFSMNAVLEKLTNNETLPERDNLGVPFSGLSL